MEIRVLIFEDNMSLRHSLYQLINGSEGFKCVGAYENCAGLIQNVQDNKPDVILMDIQMPGIDGIEAVKILRDKFPNLKIMMQTIFDDSEKIFQSIYAGASGYILKNTSPIRFLEFIKETYEGGAPMSPSVAAKVLKMITRQDSPDEHDINLSDREKEVLALLVKGMSYRRIGETCFISIDTVRTHIRNIYEKLHVHSKAEAVAKAVKSRLL